MDSGPSTYGSNKSVMAPTSSPSTKKSPSPTTDKAAQSPATAGTAKKEQPKILAVRASDVPADAIVKNIKDQPMGKVVSRVGDKPKADALVVDTGKPGQKQYQVLDKNQKVFIDNPEYTEESKATKLLSKLKIKSKKVRSIKKILRNSKFNEQREIVFEINFNDPKLARSALLAPISCGFEAETTWPSLDTDSGSDDDFLEGMRWSDVADIIYDQEGSRSVSTIEQSFNEWLMESDFYYDTEREVMNDLISDRMNDMSFITDYAYQELGADEVEDYKNETLEDLSKEEKEEYDGWGEDEWAEKLIKEKYEDSFEEWLADQIRDNGEAHDDTWERVTSEVDIDDWMRKEYGDWYSLLRDQDVFITNPNGGSGGVEAVASELEPWAEGNSMSSSVQAGEYHSGKSVDNDYWRVEEDSSIEADGAAAEIISPVYETPEQMLKEMNSLFDFFAKNDVETNSSTGLHVTMSWNGETTPVNKLKMAVLLGDKYLLGLFDRENNTYTKSQLDNVAKGISDLMKNPANLKTLSAVEEILSSKVSDNKFSSINFKDATNKAGNNLIEFRIAGGDDYHMKTTDIVKSVVRYAAIMQAGHDPEAFRKDYILALYRLIGKEAATPDPEKIKSMNIAYGDAGKNPMLLALQTSAAKNNVSSVTDYLVRGLELISKAKQLQSQQAQGDLFTPTESVNEEGEDPSRYYESGKENILMALAISAIDIGMNKSRPPKATGIAAIRKGVKELGLSTGTLWQSILSNHMVLNHAHELGLDKYELQNALSTGLSAMLKTNLGVQPEQPKSVVKYKAGDVIYVKDADYAQIQQGTATPEMFMIVSKPEQETNDAFKAKFGVDRWDTTRMSRQELKNITARTGIKFMQESVFERFEQLSLEEQLRILEKVDGAKLTEAWSKKYKDSINCSEPKGFSQKAHCAGKKKNNEDIDEAKACPQCGSTSCTCEPGKCDCEPVEENLRQWFNDKWVRFGPDGKIRGDCARGDDSEGKPKCLPQSKAHSLGKKGRASAAARKRREDPNPERKGAAKNVATKKEGLNESFMQVSRINRVLKKHGFELYNDNMQGDHDNSVIRAEWHHPSGRKISTFTPNVGGGLLGNTYPSTYISVKLHGNGGMDEYKESTAKFLPTSPGELNRYLSSNNSRKNEDTNVPFNECPQCRGPIVHESQLNEKQDACYHKVKRRYKVWPSAYASGALVQCRKKGAKNWGNSKKESVEEDYGRYYCSTDKKWKTRQGPKQKRKVKEGAVPDNRKIRILNKIMSEPLLASDIGAQMEAFFAIPDPLMVNEFRKQRAMAGDNVDLRPVVKGFINNSLHPDVQKQVNVNESIVNEYDDLGKEKAVIIKTVSGLDAKDKQQAEVLDRIYKILNSGQISTNIDVAFTKPLVDENLPEAEKAKVRKDMTRIIAGLEQDYGSMKKFLARLETAGGVVNVKELSKSLNTFENVFGDNVATAAFITLANYGVGKKQKGPGEYALACLSNKIKLAEGEGDLQMAGIGKVELKAALSSSGGRIGYGGGSQKAKRAVINKYAKYIPTVMERLSAGTGGSISIRPFIDALNTDLPTNKPNNVKVRKALMTELLTMDLEKFAGPVVNKFATSMNFDEIETEYLKQNFAWYKDRDDFDALLLMHVPNRKTAMIRSAEDLVAFRNSGHANATSISIVPTQAGAGREQWAQLTLNKAKAG